MTLFREDIIRKNTKVYTNEDHAFRALLGGLGTGNISLNSNGAMCDVEIQNQPDKGRKISYSFFALWSRIEGETPKACVLEAQPKEIAVGAGGYPSGYLYGLPRMDSCTIRTNYPFFRYDFQKKGLPLDIRLEAYTPFIPLNEKDSGIPGFRMKYTITNCSAKPAEVSVCGSLHNIVGYTRDAFDRLYQDGTPRSRQVETGGLTGIVLDNPEIDPGAVHYGSMALMTPEGDVTCKPRWMDGGWWDDAEEFWQDFRTDGRLSPDVDSRAVNSSLGNPRKPRRTGSVCVSACLKPGESQEFCFYLTWSFPNRYGWWPDGHQGPEQKKDHDKVWENAYHRFWEDALAAAVYFHENRQRLEKQSQDFSDALYSTTLDPDVIESLVMAVTVIRSNTCFLLADGHFFAWEGCFEHKGSCPGTCTHVWNYAQAMAYLFPALERSARRTEFLEETDDEGNMAFRAKRFLDGKKWDMLPAADGQSGAILRVYREWKLSGDDAFLREVWDKLTDAMEFAIRSWDSDGDFVLDSRQHNTYDIEFYGISSLTNSIFFAALEAGARMAEYLGDVDRAERWRAGLAEGSRKLDRLLYNGLYYEQRLEEDIDTYKYQYGTGCLSDQLLGQTFAHIYGLGYILPEAHVKSAVKQIYKNNFLKVMGDHESVQRTYVFADESGLILCSWPFGGRPKQPFIYSDEVWTGIEYQVATNLIYEGFTEEAMEIVHAVRRRHNGKRRSPYNEIECGNHYARSMAAWGLLIALSGYECDLPAGKMSFTPKVDREDFTCFYSNGREWGIYSGGKTTPLYVLPQP